MASPGSYIRSAARDTYSAYRSVPIRWRLAGGSAALTFVILAGFAAIVGVLTEPAGPDPVQRLAGLRDQPPAAGTGPRAAVQRPVPGSVGHPLAQRLRQRRSRQDPDLRRQRRNPARHPGWDRHPRDQGLGARAVRGPAVPDVRVLRPVGLPGRRPPARRQAARDRDAPLRPAAVQRGPHPRPRGGLPAARRARRHRAGLLAGLFVSQRAMRPIVELTDAAREIGRTRDPTCGCPTPRPRTRSLSWRRP